MLDAWLAAAVTAMSRQSEWTDRRMGAHQLDGGGWASPGAVSEWDTVGAHCDGESTRTRPVAHSTHVAAITCCSRSSPLTFARRPLSLSSRPLAPPSALAAAMPKRKADAISPPPDSDSRPDDQSAEGPPDERMAAQRREEAQMDDAAAGLRSTAAE